jgi:glycosyltransferase involved in cell wall biosynthesis
MARPSISVIVATYNRPKALTHVLEGLLNQSRSPEQIIVADDGSGEATQSCVRSFQERSTLPIDHIWQPDCGFRLARIRNLAIQASRFEYLVFLDGDCVPDAHFIEDHGRLARRGFFFQGKRLLLDAELSQRSDYRFLQKKIPLFFSKHIGNRHHLLRIPWLPPLSSSGLSGIRGCNMGIFKDDLINVNGFNEEFEGWGREDSELVVRLYKYGLKRLDHPFTALCYHLWHAENSRKELSHNDRLLAEAIASTSYYCTKGIIRDRTSDHTV